MKPETLDTTSQNSIQEKNCKLDVLNIDHFHKLYKKEKRKRSFPLKDFKLIISTFLKIYFYELYMDRVPKYFFLGGKMKIVIYEKWAKKQRVGKSEEKVFVKSDNAFGLFWYDRLTPKLFFMVKIIKRTGSRTFIPKIEKTFKANHDKDLLPIFTKEQKKGITNKTLFRCIQT